MSKVERAFYAGLASGVGGGLAVGVGRDIAKIDNELVGNLLTDHGEQVAGKGLVFTGAVLGLIWLISIGKLTSEAVELFSQHRAEIRQQNKRGREMNQIL